MGKFVIHGTLLEEPKKTVLSNGLDCFTLVVEEKFQTSYKEVVNTFSVDFMGKATNCVPTNVKLAGAPVVILGSITSREYKGRYYSDLKGEQLSVITTKSFEEKSPTLEQADINEARDPSVDDEDLANDDLPF